MNRKILALAIPNIISNITIPLLGMVDMAIVGHLGDDALIGGIAIGTAVFNFIYWNLAFLRMGTSGLAAQAYGAHDFREIAAILVRALSVALAAAMALLILQRPAGRLTLMMMDGTPHTMRYAAEYFFARIWAAPATISLFAFQGWYIGMQNSRIPMYIAITQNIVNIMASLSLVCFFGMKVEGVALGTLIAQYAGFLMGLVLWMNRYGKLKKYIVWKGVLQKEAMIRFFQVNRDIFLRTLCLVAVTLFFTSAGASQGEIILAVNTLLMQLFTLFSYVMDGFAYAGEALSGRYIGARNRKAFTDTVRHLFIWGAGLTVLFTLVYASGGNAFLALLTDDRNVITAADTYFYWALAIPAAGIFIGATATRGMLLSMAASAVSFFAVYYGFHTVLGNHALWLAFLVYLSMRGAMQTLLSRKVMEKSFH